MADRVFDGPAATYLRHAYRRYGPTRSHARRIPVRVATLVSRWPAHRIQLATHRRLRTLDRKSRRIGFAATHAKLRWTLFAMVAGRKHDRVFDSRTAE